MSPTPSPSDPSSAADAAAPARRRVLQGVGLAAVAAAALGAGWLWRRRHESGPTQDAAQATASGPARAIDLSGLWRSSFAAPSGADVHLAAFRGHPLLLNFWDPWCPPCIHELPLLDQFYTAHRAQGWQVLGIAVDGPTPVREFLGRHPLSYPVALAGLGGVDLMQVLGNSDGGLPYTLIIDSQGRAADHLLGPASPQHLERWLDSVR
jgi:thiol-disulfide isomerase/thioredoxin